MLEKEHEELLDYESQKKEWFCLMEKTFRAYINFERQNQREIFPVRNIMLIFAREAINCGYSTYHLLKFLVEGVHAQGSCKESERPLLTKLINEEMKRIIEESQEDEQ